MLTRHVADVGGGAVGNIGSLRRSIGDTWKIVQKKMDADTMEPGLVNCLMLVTWPVRQEMIEHAVLSFIHQDYPARTLTIVNDGASCRFCSAFLSQLGCRGLVVDAPHGASIGEKRNLGAAAVPAAEFIASFDDDDFSLPSRLRLQVERMGQTHLWLSASRKFIALQTLSNIVGFEHGRCFGAGMIRAEVARALPWPHVSYREDQKMYEAARAHPSFGAACMVEADDLTYVHRRHETNASAAHRQNLWQGVMPLQLAGAEALGAVELVRSLLAAPAACTPYVEGCDRDGERADAAKGSPAKKPRTPVTAAASSSSRAQPTARPKSAVTPLSRQERERLDAKYGRIAPPSAEEVRRLGEDCKMQ